MLFLSFVTFWVVYFCPQITFWIFYIIKYDKNNFFNMFLVRNFFFEKMYLAVLFCVKELTSEYKKKHFFLLRTILLCFFIIFFGRKNSSCDKFFCRSFFSMKKRLNKILVCNFFCQQIFLVKIVFLLWFLTGFSDSLLLSWTSNDMIKVTW